MISKAPLNLACMFFGYGECALSPKVSRRTDGKSMTFASTDKAARNGKPVCGSKAVGHSSMART